jgi:hypothetical protein
MNIGFVLLEKGLKCQVLRSTYMYDVEVTGWFAHAGYRDAQCGWIEVQEETRQRSISSRNNTLPRLALFLVIYVPKQGIIEIWTMQQGPRVAKFTASKSGRW